jgi:hypothetical protein
MSILLSILSIRTYAGPSGPSSSAATVAAPLFALLLVLPLGTPRPGIFFLVRD